MSTAQNHGDTDTPNPEVTMDGAALIAAERWRCVDAEGYDSAHDDGHRNGELVLAARCYLDEDHRGTYGYSEDSRRPPLDWPWEPEAWRPTSYDRVRELVKAGALVAAEIDRLQRAQR